MGSRSETRAWEWGEWWQPGSGVEPGHEVVTLATPMARGRMEHFAFAPSFACGTAAAESLADHEADWRTGGQGIVTFSTVLAGAAEVRVGDLPAQARSPPRSWITRQGPHDSFYRVAGGQSLRSFTVSASPDFLVGLLDGRVPRALRPLIEKDEAAALLANALFAPHAVLAQALDPAVTGALRRMRVEGIALFALAGALNALAGEEIAGTSGNDDGKLRLARDLLLHDIAHPPGVAALAGMVRLSPWRLTRGFQRLFGMTPQRLLLMARMNAAREMLRSETISVKEVAWRVGYAHTSSFVAAHTRLFGAPPRTSLRSFDPPTGGGLALNSVHARSDSRKPST